MRKIFSLFAALTLSVGLWADATYKADGSKLMAYGVGDYTEANPVTLTIKAPADAMFNGTAIGVTLEGQSAWTNAGLEIPAIKYDGIAHVPIMLGNHIATISAGGATASLNYKITTVLNYKSIFDGGIPSGDWVVSTNVDWDDIEQCAVFDGNASHLVIQNPLSNVDASTGFTITTEVYISNLNNTSGTYKRKNGSSAYKNGWQRLFDLSDGSTDVYFFLNAGSAAHLRCAGTLKGGYQNEFQADISPEATYYNNWHIITLVVAPGGNITLYVDNTVVSYLESNDKIERILNDIHDFTNCYIGTSIFEYSAKGTDGFFIGKIRGFQIAEGPLMPYYDGSYHYYLGYETNGGNAIAGSFQNNLPNPLPTPTHTDTQKEFAGWYMDAAFTTPAVAGAPLTKNTTLYAKWNVPTPAVGEQFFDATSGLFFEVTAVGDNNTVKVIPSEYEKSSYIIPASVTYKNVALAVTEIDEVAFANRDALNSITIPASVITIGEYAFQYCDNLATVTFAEGSQLATIGYEAFYGCEALTSITLPASVTTIGEEAFSNCTELISITIPASVTTIGEGAFSYCDALASVTFAEGSQLQTIGAWAFNRCEVLPNITIPASVTEIGEKTFLECTALTDIYVEAANTHYISEDGVLFDYAKDKLIQYPIGNTRTTYTIPTTVTTIELYSFYIATLTSVNIPASVTTIGESAFGECEALTSINIPASVTEIGELAFAFCSKLATITFAEGSQLTTVGYGAFSGCEVISSLDIPASVTNIGEMAFGYNPNLYNVTVHWTDANQLPEMGEEVFDGIAEEEGPSAATLHVPTGTKDMYEAADQWQDFIIEELAPAVEVYTRDVTEGNWGTICLPWESVALEGGDFYNVLGTKHAEKGVALTPIEAPDQLEAGKPYVFKATSEQIKVTYNPATEVAEEVYDDNHIIGSFEGCTVPNGMYIIYNNLLYITDGSSTIGANRAYFDADNMEPYNPATAPARVVFMGGHQAPTELKVRDAQCTMHDGKYLINGQFVIIKDNKMYNAQGIEL